MHGIILAAGVRAVHIFSEFLCDSQMGTAGCLRVFSSEWIFLCKERFFFGGRVHSASNARWSRGLSLSRAPAYRRFYARSPHRSGSEETWHDSCMPKNRWTGIKAVMLGYFTPEVVCQVARCISKSLRVFSFASANPGYNSQISTMRGAELSRPENRRGVSHKMSQGFGEFCLGSSPPQDSVCVCDGLTSVSQDK